MKIKTKQDHICNRQIMIAVIKQLLREVDEHKKQTLKK